MVKAISLLLCTAIYLTPANCFRNDWASVIGGEKTMSQTEINQLSVDFGISPEKVERGDELEIKVVFTNRSPKELQLNTLFLENPHVLLKTRHADGSSVHPSSPGFPPEDDGQSGRIRLKPNESSTFVYRGADYFGAPLPPDKYQMRFSYENQISKYGDWTGAIETGWESFEIDPEEKVLQ